jgi:DNA-binding SARP family transcriptional activator/tetratricopeptide (TPR) repeat protein
MGRLQLALLGVPEVRHSGRVLRFRRKELALLVYLAVAGGFHSREKLLTLFWPESASEQGRATLRRTLADLRNTLEDAPGSSHLHIEREQLGFDATSDAELDLHVLERVYTLARESSTRQSLVLSDLLSQLEHALSLYRGPFLEGFSLNDAPEFDDWVALQREVCHRHLELLFERLSQLQVQRGDVTGAVETATRWTVHDPLNESAYRRLMEAYLAAGNRNAALHTFEAYRLKLLHALDARPSTPMEALAASLRTEGRVRQPVSDEPHNGNTGVASNLSPLALQESMSAPITTTLLSGPLIGRTGEFTRLIEAYRATARGRAGVVILKGEAGLGKTRLATEFLDWTGKQGADVLAGRAFEARGGLPYQPLVDALRVRIERENAPDDLLSDPWMAELARLLPELRDRYPDLAAASADESAARIRLFESVTRLVRALAQRAPVVLFIDDLPWADTASLDLLHYAARHWQESNTPVLLLATLRLEALEDGPLNRWLAHLERGLAVVSLTLEALSGEDTQQLLRSLGTARMGTLSHWLFAETHGQPFYIMETLKALVDRGLLKASRQGDGSWLVDYVGASPDTIARQRFLPAGVREVIRARLEQISPATFALLVAGAVLGHNFTFEQLYQVAGLSESEWLPALDEALGKRLLHELGEESGDHFNELYGTYFFTHDKIRDVVYTEAGEARRRVFHRRALEVLQDAAAPAAELARHALAARLPEQSFRLSLDAGDEAMQLFAVRDALPHYERARRVAAQWQSRQHVPQGIVDESMQHLYSQLGRAYELLSEVEQARPVYQEMLAFAQASDVPEMECVALNRLAILMIHHTYDLEQALSLSQQALRVAEKSHDTMGLAETEWSIALLDIYRFEIPSAIVFGKRALELARQLEQPALIARCLNVLCFATEESGLWEESASYAQEALSLHRQRGDRAMEVEILNISSGLEISVGRLQSASDMALEAQKIALATENWWGQTNALFHLALVAVEQGEYGKALATAQRCVSMAQKDEVVFWQGNSLVPLGMVYRAILVLDKARAAHEKALAFHRKINSLPLSRTSAAELCADCALAGAWSEAASYALQAMEPHMPVFLLCSRLQRWYEIEALLRAGEVEQVVEYVQRLGEAIGTSKRHRISYLRSLAVLDHYRGEEDKAIAHLQEAAQLAEEIGLPGELWLIQAALAELYRQQGNEEESSTAFRRAASILHRLADSLEDADQRTAFLASPQVRRILERKEEEVEQNQGS